MKFTDFTANTDIFTTKTLGGISSQFKLVPELRLKFSDVDIKKRNPKSAAVLALFFPDEFGETNFLLTQRANYKGTHSAQISFPGGKKDEIDIDLNTTALREAEEEVGIIKNEIITLRKLTETYIPPSNFMVTPFLAYTNQTPVFKPNYEVAELIIVKLSDLLNQNNISSIKIDTSYMKNMEVPCFKLNNYIVWGATAMILSEIKDLLKS